MATVEKRGKGYRITVAAGMDANGKQIRVRTNWTPDEKLTPRQIEKELARQVVLFEEQVKAGSATADGGIRFADFAERYMREYAQLKLKPTTLDNYTRNLVRINQALGHIRLKDLTPLHIQSFYNNLQEEGIRVHTTATGTEGLLDLVKARRMSQAALATAAGVARPTVSNALRGVPVNFQSAEKIAAALGEDVQTIFQVSTDTSPLAAGTIHAYHRTLSAVLERAVKWRIIPTNPAERAELPSLAGHKARYLDEPDAKRMLQLLRAEPVKWRAPIIFDLLSGLRRGELLGLRWDDVDLQSQVIRVAQTSNYVAGAGVYTDTPKTVDSGRYLKISRTAILLLQEYKQWQDDCKAHVGDAWEGEPGDERVFTSETGRPIFPTSLTQWMSKFVKRSGLPPSSVHSLRHTYASLLIADGMPLVVVSGNLGHAQVSTTSDIYSHVIASTEAKAAAVMDRFEEDVHPQSSEIVHPIFTPKDNNAKIS